MLKDVTLKNDIPSEIENYNEDEEFIKKCMQHINFIVRKNRNLIADAQASFDAYIDKKPTVASYFQKNILKALQLELDLVKTMVAIKEMSKDKNETNINDNRTVIVNLDKDSRRMIADVISGRFRK